MPLRPRTALLVLCLLVFSPAEAFIRTPGMFVDNRRNVSLSGGEPTNIDLATLGTFRMGA